MRIQEDFEELKNKTTRALINADVETLEELGVIGNFPYWGPGHELRYLNKNEDLVNYNNEVITYNPFKGYIKGLFMQDNDGNVLRPSKVGELTKFTGFSDLDENTVEIKSIKYGEFAKIPRYLQSRIEWGEIEIEKCRNSQSIIKTQKVRIYGKIILSPREISSEENHIVGDSDFSMNIKWGFTMINYWYVNV